MQSDMEMKQSNIYQQNPAPPPYSSQPPYPGPTPQGYPINDGSQNVAYGTNVAHPAPTVVAATVVPGAMIVTNQMSSSPSVFICKSCNARIVTRVERKPALRTHLFALLLCLVGCWPCACVPYFMDSCRNADHYCPECNAYIGSYLG